MIDTVAYTDLSKNVTYVVKGTLMLTGDAPLMINGKPVTAEAEFIPTENNGTVDVKFTFEANNLDDKSLVVFEEIYRRTVTEDGKVVDELIGEHKDIEDKDQTINFNRTVKTGGLPNWAWLAMAITLFTVAGAMLGVLVYRRRNQKK